MRSAPVQLFNASGAAAEMWPQPPQIDVRPVDLSHKGSVSRKVKYCPKCSVDKEVSPPLGRAGCEQRVLLVVRGITQLDSGECFWSLRATHNWDEVRRPKQARKSAQMTGCRVVCGPPDVDESADLWPGADAAKRPAASSPGGEPHAEPDESPQPVVVSQFDLSALPRDRQSQQLSHALPVSVVDRLTGGSLSAPEFPLDQLQQDQLEAAYGAGDLSSRRGVPFELGRAPFDSKYSAPWRAFFESFAPIGRSLATACRHLVRSRFE